jgi:exosortase/archaeosortase family protein
MLGSEHPEPGPASDRGLEPRSRFVAAFLVLSGVGLGAYFFPYDLLGIHADGTFVVYLSAYARLTGLVLHLLDPAVSVVDSTINGRFAMQIVRSCDAMEANILFVAAVLAFPGPWARKAVALPAGLAALVATNVARLCCLYFVGVYAPARFDFAHYELWPLAMVAFATVDFLLCARWMAAGDPAIDTPQADADSPA